MPDAGKDTLVASNQSQGAPTLLGVNEPIGGWNMGNVLGGFIGIAGAVATAVSDVAKAIESPQVSVANQTRLEPDAPAPTDTPTGTAQAQSVGVGGYGGILALIAVVLLFTLFLDRK